MNDLQEFKSANRYIRGLYNEVRGFGCRPDEALIKSRKIAEAVSKQLLRFQGEADIDEKIMLHEMINKLRKYKESKELPIPGQVITSLISIKDRANEWCHENASPVPRQLLRSALADLSYLVEWYFYEVLGEKRSLWKASVAFVLHNARSVTVLGLAWVIGLAFGFAILVLLIGIGIYQNFLANKEPPQVKTEQVESNAAPLRDLVSAMAPKPAFVKLNSDPAEAWCWVYPKMYSMMMDLKKADEQDESDLPLFGRTPFGRVSRNLSMMAFMGGAMGERGLEAFVFKPGYVPKIVNLDKITSDVDFGTVKLMQLDDNKAPTVTIQELSKQPLIRVVGTVAELEGTVSLVRKGSDWERNLGSTIREARKLTIEDLPKDPVFLSFSEPPFSDVLAVIVSPREFDALAERWQVLRASEPVAGRFTVYFPVAPFNASQKARLIAQLRRVNGVPVGQ